MTVIAGYNKINKQKIGEPAIIIYILFFFERQRQNGEKKWFNTYLYSYKLHSKIISQKKN